MGSSRSWPYDDDEDRPSGSVPPPASSEACWHPAEPDPRRPGRRGHRLGTTVQASPDAVAWRRGAAGERRTARLLSQLERHRWAILHEC
jgi:hypothetical protein